MSWSRVLSITLLTLTLLAGCGRGNSVPTASAPPAAQPQPTATVTSTVEPTSTPTVEPIPSPTPLPTPTAAPAPADPAIYHEIFFNGLDEGGKGNLRLYTVDADGSDLHPLTSAPDGVWEGFPAPSPDGTRVAFLRGFSPADEGEVPPPAEVRVVDLLTGEETLIVTGLGTDFTWSPDSHQLAFTWLEGGSNPCCGGTQGLTSRLVLVNADGSDLRVLSEEERDPVTFARRADMHPVWSPDGQSLLFLRSRSTATDSIRYPAILDLETLEVRELDTGDVLIEYEMAWSPNGHSIAFHGGSTDLSAPRGVYVLNINDSAMYRLTDADLSVSGFSISPNGWRMALAARYETATPGAEETPTHLFVLDLFSGQLREYESGWLFHDLAWSPDGSRISYIENQVPANESSRPVVRFIAVDTGTISNPLATIWLTELTRGIPAWRPALVVPPEPDHGWSDDTLQAIVPVEFFAVYLRPQLDYPWIVWSAADRLGDSDINAINLETGQTATIATDQYTDREVQIEDGMVVWSEHTCDDCPIVAIHGKDLLSGRAFTLDVPSSVSWYSPDFSGRWLVWSEYPKERKPDQLMTIFAQDMRSMSEPFIVTEVPVPYGGKAVSGDLVAVVQPLDGNAQASQIVVQNLTTGETVATIDTLEPGNEVHQLDLHGSTLVHVESGGWLSDSPTTIVVTDLAAGSTRTLETDVYTGQGALNAPGTFPITTDGRFILFQQDVTMGYDLERDAWFSLPFWRHYNDLDEGMLTWAIPRHYLNGPTELHLAPAEDFSSGLRSRYYPETDHWLSLGFLKYWDANGGLPAFGYPIGRRTFGEGRIAEWTERQRLEWHPEDAGTVYDIQLGRLGAELLDQQHRDWREFPTADPAASHYFAETGHAIAPEFWDEWSSRGLDLGDRWISFRESVALFGYPLSEPMAETNADGDTVLTQYFERAVFEYHPDNPVEYQVLLRRLGAELVPQQGQ